MQLRQLESFVMVCETKSFTLAAQRLFLSQPAISQHIRSLENDLGCDLLEHQRRSVVLTRNGEVFYAYAKDIVALYHKARLALDTGEQMFCLHFVNASQNDPLQRILLRFYMQHPDCHVELMPPIPVELFRDAARLESQHLYLVQKKWLKDESIRFVPLGQTRFACILSPEDPLAARRELTLDDLKERTVCQRKSTQPANGPFMYELLAQMKAQAIQTVTVGDLSKTIARIISDRGRSVLLMPYYVSVMEQSGTLRRTLRLNGESTIGLAYKGVLTPAMQAFVRMAGSCYAE